jgi:hypothetical protein
MSDQTDRLREFAEVARSNGQHEAADSLDRAAAASAEADELYDQVRAHMVAAQAQMDQADAAAREAGRLLYELL